MKILHVLQSSFPRLYGYCVRGDSILRAQQAHGLEVVAMTGGVEDLGQGDEELINGVRYYRTPCIYNRSRRGLREWRLHRQLVKRLTEVAERERPDVIHVHSPAYNGLAALKVARRRKIPCVYEMRAVWEDAAADRNEIGATSLLYRMAHSLETYVFRHADAVVTICEGLRAEVLSRGIPAEKVLVVPNGVDVEYFQPRLRDTQVAATLGLTGEGPVFGFIGTMFAFEGVEELVAAIPQVVARFPKVQFLIVGGGQRERQVKESVGSLNCGNSINLVSRVPHDQVRALYTVVDCMVYPRRSIRLTELVTPLKPLEAMAMQKTVLASNIGGHREMVEHDHTGMLFQAGDAGALVGSLCRAAAEPALLVKLAQAGRQYVVEHRNWKSVTANYLPMYDSVVASKRAAGH
ncbi:MAG TPA: TIGR04063 family PEP-CTERM/XrtA system glycosyltransferase [Terriglobia bacterium]|nr:TIGR04063 family PEP-CTERM/XrtA system glycosyltransferase [Terriglobia bacterium]